MFFGSALKSTWSSVILFLESEGDSAATEDFCGFVFILCADRRVVVVHFDGDSGGTVHFHVLADSNSIYKLRFSA